MSMMYGGPRKAFAVRFEPGTDLVPAMQEAAHQAMTMSGSLSSSSCLSQSTMILSAVGSMSQATVRMASAHRNDILNTHDFRTWYKPMEIVSLVGTFAVPAVDMVQGGALLSPPSPSYGPFHLQMSFSDDNGHVYGGHVVSGTVNTTLELVLMKSMISTRRWPAHGFSPNSKDVTKHEFDSTIHLFVSIDSWIVC